MKKDKAKAKALFEEFKTFISKGSVIDMAVGVIMGSSFSAIVTAVTNILLSICTWGVPGGISGLVTVLPAINETQKGYEALNLKASYTMLEWSKLTEAEQSLVKTSFVQKGSTWYYKDLAVIDWGTLINAVITFVIIALFLFTVLKVFHYLKKKREEFEKMQLELFYQKHPEKKEEEKTESK